MKLSLLGSSLLFFTAASIGAEPAINPLIDAFKESPGTAVNAAVQAKKLKKTS